MRVLVTPSITITRSAFFIAETADANRPLMHIKALKFDENRKPILQAERDPALGEWRFT